MYADVYADVCEGVRDDMYHDVYHDACTAIPTSKLMQRKNIYTIDGGGGGGSGKSLWGWWVGGWVGGCLFVVVHGSRILRYAWVTNTRMAPAWHPRVHTWHTHGTHADGARLR